MTAASIESRDFIGAVRDVYERFRSASHPALGWLSAAADFREWLSPRRGNFSGEWKALYESETRAILKRMLDDFGAAADAPIRQTLERNFYASVLPGLLSSHLFWIWEEDVVLSADEQSELLGAMLEGIVGHRLIDLHLDGNEAGPDAVVLGEYMVRAYECRLARVFGEQVAWPILMRYSRLFAEVEFLEKSSLWKPCPIAHEEVYRIGWKVAPLTAVLHLIFDRAGRPAAHIAAVCAAVTRLFAAVQMIDDWHDAAFDLAHGTETPAARGFYDWNAGQPITDARVDEYLRGSTMRHLDTVLELLRAAAQELEKWNEALLRLSVEFIRNRFLADIRVAGAGGSEDR